VRIGLDEERLSVETATGSATQDLSSCASALELWFETRAAGSVQITQAGRSWPETLPVGAHEVRLPALATEVRLQSGDVSIERVQALGAGRR
jgi:hypothetical protein